MKLKKQLTRFIKIAVVVAGLTLFFSRIHMFGMAISPYPSSPNEISLVTYRKQATSESEALGKACLSESEAGGALFIGEYQQSHERFQIWELTISQQPVLRINSLFGTACGLAYDSRYNTFMSDEISPEIAQQLALILYQNKAEALGGVDVLQANYDTEAQELSQYNEISYLPAETIGALTELGIELAPEYQLYDPENPPQMRRSSRGEI